MEFCDRPDKPQLADFALWVRRVRGSLGHEAGRGGGGCQANSAEALEASSGADLYQPLACGPQRDSECNMVGSASGSSTRNHAFRRGSHLEKCSR